MTPPVARRARAAVVMALTAIAATTSSPRAWAQPPSAEIVLWPEGVPGAKAGAGIEREEDGRVYNVQSPTLSYYPPSAGTAVPTAVIVCPGGGYARLAMANEAAGAVRALQPLGVSVFVLKYRLAEFGYPAPLQDILRAVRLVRARAGEFGVRPDRIGVFGASAGGHLAAAAATLFDAEEGHSGAAIDATSARPDFVALLYPVITMRDPFVHADSRRNLLGATPTETLLDRMSIETRVRADMPPVFLVHTAEDTSVPIENSVRLLEALRRCGRAGRSAFLRAWPARLRHGRRSGDDLGLGRPVDGLDARPWLALTHGGSASSRRWRSWPSRPRPVHNPVPLPVPISPGRAASRGSARRTSVTAPT